MKKKIIGIILIILISTNLIDFTQEKVSRSLVDHKEAAYFINLDDINLNGITMLHWPTKEIQVYSDNDSEAVFVLFNTSRGRIIYINQKLRSQNEGEQYANYQPASFLTYDIHRSDYEDHRVDIYDEVTSKYTSSPFEDECLFVGSFTSMNQLIVVQRIIRIGLALLVCLSALLYLSLFKQRKIYRILPFAVILTFFSFSLGLKLALALILLASTKILKKQHQLYALIVLIPITLFLPITSLTLLSIFYLSLLLLSYYKKPSDDTLWSIIVLSMIIAISNANLEFSLFKLFIKESYWLIFSMYFILLSIFKMKQLLSTEKTVRVDLLRGIAHDLKLPMSSIALNTDLLLEDGFNSELKKKQSLYMIKTALEDMTYMANSLSIYTSNDIIRDNKFKSSLQDAITQATNHFKNNTKQITFYTQLLNEDCFFPIEAVWLNRLVYNLVDNAYKYTDDFGEILITLTKLKKEIVLTVRDNGIGMAPDEIEKIFEPFYRIDSARQTSGMGLGLSIVKSIVDALDGEITIRSKLGTYTEFEIRF